MITVYCLVLAQAFSSAKIITPLTVEQVAQIRYGERPDVDGPENNPIL